MPREAPPPREEHPSRPASPPPVSPLPGDLEREFHGRERGNAAPEPAKPPPNEEKDEPKREEPKRDNPLRKP
jgi:hypothetical protein